MSLTRRLLLACMGAGTLAPVFRVLGRGLVSIFTLHRFADRHLGVVGHDPVALREHLAYLRRHRYRLLSLTDLLTLLENGDDRPTAPAVAFTVDDGYGGFARIAAPIFAEYDCPVTLFVTTGFLDGDLWMWWDRVTHLFQQTRRCAVLLASGSEELAYQWSTPEERDRVLQELLCRLEWVDRPEREIAIAALSEQLDVELPTSPPPACAPISWDEVRRTAKLGVTFGPHTVTHRILSLAPEEDCRWEVEESYRRLREETDAWVPVFCYPNGETRACGERELAVVQQAGLQAAMTTVPDYTVPGRVARFALPRFPYPDDRPHLVHTVAGLVRLKRMLQAGRSGKPSAVAPLLTALSAPCAV